MAFLVPFERESQVGYLRVRLYSKKSRFFDPNHVITSLSSCFLLMMSFSFLTIFCLLATFADKTHVVPRLSFTNIAALNYLLRSEIFISENRQLRLNFGLPADLGDISRCWQRYKSSDENANCHIFLP